MVDGWPLGIAWLELLAGIAVLGYFLLRRRP